MHKRKIIGLSVSLFVLLSIFFCRDLLLAKGAEIYLSRLLAKEQWLVSSITSEGNCTRIFGARGHTASGEGSIKQIDIVWHLSVFPLALEPMITLYKPSFSFDLSSTLTETSSFGLLSSQGFWAPKIQVEEGEVVFPRVDAAFSFAVIPEEKGGCLIVKEKGEVQELFQGHFYADKDKIQWKGELYKTDISSLFPFISLALNTPFSSPSRLKGDITALIECSLQFTGEVENIRAELVLEGLDIADPQRHVDMQLKMLRGSFQYAPKQNLPLWKQCDLFLTFEGSSLYHWDGSERFGVENALGELRVHPAEDPYLKALGSVIVRNAIIPFEIEGNGELLEKGAYWMQSTLAFSLPRTQPKIVLSLCQSERGETALEAECSQVGKEIAYVIQKLSPISIAYELEKGTIEGKVLGHFANGSVQSVELLDCKAEQVALALPDKNFFFTAQECSFQGLFIAADRKNSGGLSLQSAQSEVHQGDILLGDLHLAKIASKISINGGLFDSSYVEGIYKGIKTSIQVLDAPKGPLFHVECGAYPKDIKKWFLQKEEEEEVRKDPVFLALDITEEEGKAHFSAVARFFSEDKEEDLELEGKIHQKISRKFSDLWTHWDLESLQGSFIMNTFSEQTFLPYVGCFLDPGEWKSSGKLRGSFDKKGVEVVLSQVELLYEQSPDRHYLLEMGQQNPIRLFYNRESKEWKGIIPLHKGVATDSSLQASIEFFDTILYYRQGKIWSDCWQAKSSNFSATGQFFQEGPTSTWITKQFHGDIQAVKTWFPLDYPSMLEDWTGEFINAGGDSSCSLTRTAGGIDIQWQLSCRLQKMKGTLQELGLLEDGKALVHITSLGEVHIKEAEALYRRASFSCQLAMQDISYRKGEPTAFQLAAKEGGKEFFRLAGWLDPIKEGQVIHFDEKTHLFGVALHVDPLYFDARGHLQTISQKPTLTVSFSFNLSKLPSYLTLSKKLGLDVHDNLPSLGGDLYAKISYNKETELIRGELQTPGLFYSEKPLGELKVIVDYQKGALCIRPSSLGPYAFQMKSNLQVGKQGKKEWKISSFTLDGGGFGLTANGLYVPQSQTFQIAAFSAELRKEGGDLNLQGTFNGRIGGTEGIQGQGKGRIFVRGDTPFPWMLCPTKDVSFTVTNSKDVEIEGGRLELWNSKNQEIVATCAVPKISYDLAETEVQVQGATLLWNKVGYALLPPEVLTFFGKKDPQIQFSGLWSPSKWKLKGSVKKGTYNLHSVPFEAKQLTFSIQPDLCQIICEAVWKKEPFFVEIRHSLAAPYSGQISVREELGKSGLICQYSQDTQGMYALDKVRGTLKGFSGTIEKKSSIQGLTYNADISVDFSKIIPFFPSTAQDSLKKWKLGSGYKYVGTVTLRQDLSQVQAVDGQIIGDQFQFLGKTLGLLRAKVEFSGNKAEIRDILVQDEAGSLSCKTIGCYEKVKGEPWEVKVPLIHVKELSPSWLTKGKKEGVELKNISVYKLSGLLGDPQSFIGTGSVQFVSPLQKEFSFWDVPLTMIKDLGLDPGLLTPVSGEADFTMSRGKLYFTQLKNVFSEGERSQFDLADPGTDAYLTLGGEWHVDLQMRQNVVLKVAEGFVLSIRGTLEKPKYSFKRKI